MRNEEIANEFYNNGQAKNKNMFIENYNGVKVVFSYGEHFPISIKFEDGFLFTNSGYSQSTSRHKNLVLAYVKDELSETDFKTCDELKKIVSLIKYDGVKSKAELIEKQI